MPEATAVRRGWFDDTLLVASLPFHFRLYAAYSRLAVDRASGVVHGGSFLLRLLRRLTPLLRLPRTARVRVGDRVAWVDLTDQRVLWVFDELRGASEEYRVMKELLRTGDTFIDVGANHGSFAILAAPLVGARGRVVAIEAQPNLAQLVERSLAETGVPFEVHAVAVGAQAGSIELHVPDAGSGAASRYAGYAMGSVRTVQVPMAALDALLDWQSYPGRIVLKLDVEGSEMAFLEGASRLISERRPHVLFEVNADSAAAGGYTVDALLGAFAHLGYRFAELSDIHNTVAAGAVSSVPQRNLLAVPEAM